MTSKNSPILVVTGETSGEQHAAGLVRLIREQYTGKDLEFFGCGGRHMADEGVQLLLDVSRLAIIGTWEAIANLAHYLKLYRRLLVESRTRRPRLAILVDFPDFNLRLARRLKKLGIPVCYFIGPQVWAWKRYRLRQIERRVDLLLVIFPFEEEFYRRLGIAAHYVGNPTLSTCSQVAAPEGNRDAGEQRVALLPGSRKKEVELIFPVQLDAARHVASRRTVQFWVSVAPHISKDYLVSLYRHWLSLGNSPLSLEFRREETRKLLPEVDCAIVKSGTSTLEATILKVPFAMMYRVSKASWYLMRPLVRTQTYCLANLVAGKQIVPEFIQQQATGETIGAYILELLEDEEKRNRMKTDLEEATAKLGEREAYAEGARRIIERFLVE